MFKYKINILIAFFCFIASIVLLAEEDNLVKIDSIVCTGNTEMIIQNNLIESSKEGISVSKNCELIILDSQITSSTALDVSGNGEVFIVNTVINGSKAAIKARDNATVRYVNSTVKGKITSVRNSQVINLSRLAPKKRKKISAINCKKDFEHHYIINTVIETSDENIPVNEKCGTLYFIDSIISGTLRVDFDAFIINSELSSNTHPLEVNGNSDVVIIDSLIHGEENAINASVNSNLKIIKSQITSKDALVLSANTVVEIQNSIINADNIAILSSGNSEVQYSNTNLKGKISSYLIKFDSVTKLIRALSILGYLHLS